MTALPPSSSPAPVGQQAPPVRAAAFDEVDGASQGIEVP
jgi:hypothetical protein